MNRRKVVLATEQWARFLALGGCKLQGKTVADFNDAGLMLQVTEGDLGIALAREVLAADALQAGRLVRVSPLELEDRDSATYWFVNPPDLAAWPPLMALRQWLAEEMAISRRALWPPTSHCTAAAKASGKGAPGQAMTMGGARPAGAVADLGVR